MQTTTCPLGSVAPAPPRVRLYRAEDRDDVRRVYADTAFFGDPVEAYFDDRELFADLGVSVYTDHEPHHVVVLDDGGAAVGYALGSTGGPGAAMAYTRHVLPAIVGRLLRGRYRIGRRTLGFTGVRLGALLRGELLEIHSEEYPANLHIDVLPQYRGRGLGSALLREYLELLRGEGVRGVHLVTTNRNQAALVAYQRAGFHLLAERTTRMWRPYLPGDTRLMAFGLQLCDSGA